MKAQLGRPTGLALALLATLLATFLAMGVFSVALAQRITAPPGAFPQLMHLGRYTVTIWRRREVSIDQGDDEGVVRGNAARGFQLNRSDSGPNFPSLANDLQLR